MPDDFSLKIKTELPSFDEDQDGGRVSRRMVLGGAAALLASSATGVAAAAPARAPKGFLWGTATSAQQTEGNNVNSDIWLCENVKPTLFKERSGDACDSYHRYEEDAALAGRFGFNCQRFGIEWARIEPEPGQFSIAELDHYARVLEACHRHGLAPFVTLSHYSLPRWFAARGGFEVPDGADLFARYADRVARALGDRFAGCVTFNEPNMNRQMKWMPIARLAAPMAKMMMAAAAHACGSDRFSSVIFGNADVVEPIMLDAHAKAYQAIKATHSNFPVGPSLAMSDEQGVGPDNGAERKRQEVYGAWLGAAAKSDFVGVQTYTRMRVGKDTDLGPEPGVELTASGYEFYPQALGATIRYAAKLSGKPVYVTENGIATDNDARRIAYIDVALDQVRQCLANGIDVRSYIHWSLIDNWEWFSGYGPKFGLIAVDRQTFKRTPKPSASYLGNRARADRL